MADDRRAAQEQAYHVDHRDMAHERVAALAASGRNLSAADARRCEGYAVDVLGDACFSPWLKVYCAFRGSFVTGWIPENFYGARVVPRIQGPHGRISLMKSLVPALFGGAAFPDVGARIHGRLLDRAYQPLSIDAARDLYFADSAQIMFKPDGTGRGNGIVAFDREHFTAVNVARVGDGVFQRRIVQHQELARFAPDAVATLRLTTVIEPSGEPSMRGSYIGFALGGETHIRYGSAVSVEVDPATGILGQEAVLSDWSVCRAHPTSGEPFGGTHIPAFAECVDIVLSLHRRVAFVGCIGWDVAVDSAGKPQVLEWNGFHNGIKLCEAAQGPCFTGLGWEKFA